MDRKGEESLICSPPYHGQAMAKHIKASFRSPVWSVCSCLFSSCVDSQPTVWTVREHQACRSKEEATFSIFRRRKGRGRVEWAGGRCRGGDWAFGDFCQKHERAFVLGGMQCSEDWLCSPCIYRGCMNIWLMSHRLRGSAISVHWLYKASWSPTQTHTCTHSALLFNTAV